MEACIAAGLVGGEDFAVDARLIVADANKQRSIPGKDWDKNQTQRRRAVKEYLAALEDAVRHGEQCDAEVRVTIHHHRVDRTAPTASISTN